MHRPTAVLVLTLLAGAPALRAQSRPERDTERAADRIARVVEQQVEAAMRTVNDAMRNLHQGRRHDDLQDGGTSIDTTFRFSRDGVVDLTSITGDIVVTGWARDEIHVRARSERGRLRWRFSSTRATIETESMRGHDEETRYELSVPQGVRVIARSSTGGVTVHGVRGPLDAHSMSGDLDVSDAIDRVELSSLSGDIQARGLRGQVEAGSVNGTVELQDVDAESLQLESTSGDLVMTNVHSRDVSASTVSGQVEYHGGIEPGGQYEFQSHAGDITLDIPANTNARISVQTYSGSLDSGGFPVTLQPDRGMSRGRRLEFTLGTGGDARVVAETFSGDIQFQRRARR